MIDEIVGLLVTLYREHFNRDAGDLGIKRVTANVPEVVGEWPWLYWVVDEGDVELLTFDAALEGVARRRRPLPTFAPRAVRRPKVLMTHRFKAQLLVQPRRDLVADEARVRPFIAPFVLLMAENLELGGRLAYCKVTGYRYGVIEHGRVDDRAVQFAGVEFMFEAQEMV